MKISVACAVFNGTKYLEKQLDSLRNQSVIPDEVIFYDDASTDTSVQCLYLYIEKYQLVNWKFYRQETNVGYIRNFISALRKTSGDIIFLCDQDDIWEYNKIEVSVRYLEDHPTISCINSAYTCVNHNDEIITDSITPDATKLAFHNILLKNSSMGCTMALRRDLLDYYVQHTNAQAPHDWELNLLAASNKQLQVLKDSLIRYRIHSDNTTGIDTLNKSTPHIDDCSREKNAKTIIAFLTGLQPYSFPVEQAAFLKTYSTFADLRYALLADRNIINWFKLLRYISIYATLLSPKGILADLLYAIRNRNRR